MESKDKLILKYSKKIYGFAYSKTHNCHDAEDLSSEIVVQLLSGKVDFDKVENKDAYIYRICCYTWSKFLRKNKRNWDMVGNGTLPDFADDTDIQQSYLDEELYLRLRHEVMYLGRMRRNIMIKHYFENMSIAEISKVLNIPESTVKWHMRETKSILKERIEMKNEGGIYQPITLSVGHSGWASNASMHGLQNDKLIQNICWLCSKKALTIDEIARTMGVASVYLEDKIETLLYMDYLKEIGGKKYLTTFHIRDMEWYRLCREFSYYNLRSIAIPALNIAKDLLPKLRADKNLRGEFNDGMLLYAILMRVINRLVFMVSGAVNKEFSLPNTIPKRKDGSEHWVAASLSFDIAELDEEQAIVDFFVNGSGCGMKTRTCDNLYSLQYDQSDFGGWREFNQDDIKKLERVVDINNLGEQPNSYDIEIISDLCHNGYAKVEDGRPIILIPFFDCADNGYHRIVEEFFEALSSLEAIDERYGSDLVGYKSKAIEHRKRMLKLVPKHLDENERNGVLTCYSDLNGQEIMHYLYYKGYLYKPTEDEKKRICTVVMRREKIKKSI